MTTPDFADTFQLYADFYVEVWSVGEPVDIYNQLEDLKAEVSKGTKLFDVNMPFSQMVLLIIKFSFASIPAAMIMGLLSLIFWSIFGRLLFNAMLRSYGMH